MTRLELIALCERWRACDPDPNWLRSLTCETAAECWDACERGDWMVWLLTRRDVIVPDRTLRLIAVDCARSVQPIADEWFAEHAPRHVGAGVRLLNLIESDPDADPTTWADARDAVRDAVSAGASPAAWETACTIAGSAAICAVDAAASSAACYAAWDVGWDDAWADAWADQARIVRARVSWDDVEAGLRGAL